ncbi:MAG: hypothetical protein AABZ15_01120 [Nitrospirota bacterium]|mgnify:CR=1 FL=1
MRSFRTSVSGILLVLAAILLSSCSGTGDSGVSSNGSVTLSSLILPDNVSVVDPKTISSAKPGQKSISSLLFGAVLTDLAPTSDYKMDKTTVYVNERSLDSFRSVSEILCMVRQSRYDVMLNQGPYIAQVDKNLCSSARSDASSAGQASTNQSSGATMPMYENWTVNSSRSSSQSPHIVQVWVHSQDNPSSPTRLIYAKIVITEGADTAPPYGVFKMNFKFYDPADLTTILARGFLNAERDVSGQVLLYFATEDKDSYEIQKATLYKDIVNNQGAGSVLKAETGPWLPAPEIMRFNLAYNLGNFLRTDSSGTICLDRDNIVESSWRYGLYTTDTNPAVPLGTRVTRNSNFQVKKGSVYGSIGYWGAWFPPVNGIPVTVSDGEQVFKHDYSNNTDTAFTVFQRGGKLKKYARKNVTLDNIKNIPLVWFDSGAAYMVIWDGAGFLTVAQMQSNGSWSSTGTFPQINLSSLPWVDLGFWSQALGGSVIVKLHDPATSHVCITTSSPYNCSTAANATTPVMYYRETIIFPGDPVPSRLACFDRCPDASKLATASPIYDTSLMSYQTVTPGLASYVSYSFISTGTSPTAMVLTDGITGAPVTAATTTSPYENGITSGILTSPTSTYWDLLACPWDANSTCPGQAGSVLPEFYIWETGQGTWNQFVTVLDTGGTPIRFDPPLQVKYIHSQPTATAPDNKYNNVTFFLEYSGFGELNGIPGKCVDIDDPSNLNVNCSDSGTNRAIRWVPEFSIPRADAAGDLTELTDVAQPAITYFIKALETEQRLGTGGTCAGLTTTPYQLPSMASWIDPIIGAEPVITAPPAVIGGVVQ